MAKSFGAPNDFGNSKFTQNNNVTHLEQQGGSINAMFENGGSIGTGMSATDVQNIINGNGTSTVIYNSGSRISYNHKTRQTRQL